MLELPPDAFNDAPDRVVARAAEASLAGERTAISLADLPIGEFATIHAVRPTDNDVDRELVLRLIEIGFVPGERVRVIALGRPGREPIAVRLSATDGGRRSLSGATFAMRRHEAGFIRVVPDLESAS